MLKLGGTGKCRDCKMPELEKEIGKISLEGRFFLQCDRIFDFIVERD